jgi:hypothetical protein
MNVWKPMVGVEHYLCSDTLLPPSRRPAAGARYRSESEKFARPHPLPLPDRLSRQRFERSICGPESPISHDQV